MDGEAGRCPAIKRNGERCRGVVTSPDGWCWSHDPSNSNQRQRTASKAGKSAKATADINEIKRRLKELYGDTLSGKTESKVAAVANQIQNTLLRALEVERRIKEEAELEERLDELESLVEYAEETRHARR